MPPIRVLIPDDHRLFAEASRRFSRWTGRIAVAATARSGREAVARAGEQSQA
jgi:DNA-binding NarL/FixJ family response regulator